MKLALGLGIGATARLAVAAPPPDVAGAAAVFNAASLAGLSHRDNVQAWADESGNGHDLVQATYDNGPEWNAERGSVAFPRTKQTGTKAALANASFVQDRASVAFLWVGRAYTCDSSNYLVRMGGLNSVLMAKDGTLQLYSGPFLDTGKPLACHRDVAVVVSISPTERRVHYDFVGNETVGAWSGSERINTGFDLGDVNHKFGEVRHLRMWDHPLSAEDCDALLTWAAHHYGTGTLATATAGLVVVDGDSTSDGTGPSFNGVWHSRLGIRPDWQLLNFGITGQQITSMSADRSEVDAHAAPGNWLFVYAGHNDLASAGITGDACHNRLSDYCAAAIAAGWARERIVTFTISMTSGAAGTSAERDAYNDLIRANYESYAGHLVDVAADPELGVVTPGGGFIDNTNYRDSVHMTDAGAEKLAALVRASVPGLPVV